MVSTVAPSPSRCSTYARTVSLGPLALPVTTCVQASSPLLQVQFPHRAAGTLLDSQGLHLWKVLEVSVTVLHTMDTEEPHSLGTEPGEGGQ